MTLLNAINSCAYSCHFSLKFYPGVQTGMTLTVSVRNG